MTAEALLALTWLYLAVRVLWLKRSLAEARREIEEQRTLLRALHRRRTTGGDR